MSETCRIRRRKATSRACSSRRERSLRLDVITDRESGGSKGFGFVEMGSEDAEKAIAQFNGTELHGRSLTVNEARPREERSSNRGGYGRGRDNGPKDRGGYNRY